MTLQVLNGSAPESAALTQPQQLLHIAHARQDEAWVRGVLIPALGSMESAAFSPDGTRVVTASAGGTVQIWDAVTGKPLWGPAVHQRFGKIAAFSPDGSRVVISNDNIVRIWDVPLASGNLDEWTAIAERSSPYVLVDGVLAMRHPSTGVPKP